MDHILMKVNSMKVISNDNNWKVETYEFMA